MSLVSPARNTLRHLEGHPGDISRRGADLVSAAEVMNRAATTLRRINDGADAAIGLSFDSVRESAGDLAPDLDKAATRYHDTGVVLRAYATALETAQTAIDPAVEEIETAHQNVKDKKAAKSAAQGLVNDHNHQMIWEDDVSDTEKAQAKSELTSAMQAAASAESELETLWGKFDQVFSTWADAYDTAVDGIESAFGAADNNDAWGEDALDTLGWIVVGITFAALFCTGTLAFALVLLGTAIGAVIVVINALKLSEGRGSWVDLTVAVVCLLPFARPLARGLSQGIKGFRATNVMFKMGRGVLRESIRASAPRIAYKPFSGEAHVLVWRGARNFAAALFNGSGRLTSRMRMTEIMTKFRVHDFFTTRPFMNFLKGGHNKVTSFAQYILASGEGGLSFAKWATSEQVVNYAPKLLDVALGPIESAIGVVGNGIFVGQKVSG